jgi:hypothetical protein
LGGLVIFIRTCAAPFYAFFAAFFDPSMGTTAPGEWFHDDWRFVAAVARARQTLQQDALNFAVDRLPQCSILLRLTFTAVRRYGIGSSHRLTRRQSRQESGTMKTQSDYRKLAEDCVRLAPTAKKTHRAMLLNMAHPWQQFAGRVADDHQWMANGHDARSDKHA